jgi:DNA polymerase V
MQDDERWLKSRRLMQTIDQINSRMGRNKVRFAVEGLKQEWKTKFEKRSPQYTTSWDELPTVA